MSSIFIHVVTCVRISFLFKAEYYSIVCIYYILFIHLFVNGHLNRFHLLAIVNNAAMNIESQISQDPASIILDIYLEIELLNHIVILFLIF